MFTLTSGQLAAAGIAAAAVGGWFALYALALLITRPARPSAAPATQDLPGTEPPAVVSLLAGGWELSEDAAESTLLDLGARKILEFRQPGNDPMQTTIHIRNANPVGLNRYEQRVFNRVSGLAVGGVVPLPALTFRDAGQATTFEKRMRAEVIADARARGLSQRRFGRTILSVLTLAAIAAAFGVALAVFLLTRHSHTSSGSSNGNALKGAGAAWLFGTLILSGIAHRPLGERDTKAGREVAAKWFGVRDWLHRTGSFGDLPPSAVAVWDRYLSYGDALGTTRVCAAVIDLGMGNRRRVWSSYGDQWHRVRVRYPGFWLRYGKTGRYLIMRGVIFGLIGFALLYYWARGVAAALHQPVISNHAARFADPVRTVGLAVGVVALVYGSYLFVRAIIDVATPARITGQVLWKQTWRTNSGGENSPAVPWLHYLAVDDGSGDRTTAWGLPSAMAGRAVDGDTVRLAARRWSRRVTELTVVAEGTGRRWQTAGNTDTEAMIAKAMSVPQARDGADPTADPFDLVNAGTAGGSAAGMLGLLGRALQAPAVPAANLLSEHEVSSALGMPVTVHAVLERSNSPVPVQPVQFRGPDGKPVMQLLAAGGMAAQLALRARRRGQPLPGIGDEAFAGEGWAVGRHGDTVVTIALSGNGKRAAAANVHWLLSTAVGRLAAPQSDTAIQGGTATQSGTATQGGTAPQGGLTPGPVA